MYNVVLCYMVHDDKRLRQHINM